MLQSGPAFERSVILVTALRAYRVRKIVRSARPKEILWVNRKSTNFNAIRETPKSRQFFPFERKHIVAH